ncbi:MAG: CaiB/BaiF CoA-transferase family protein [SAR324 cluster bacterium]|nr:CaiB/BaiF CoA-transferase family protein [SAR324 cluster bacterium]
MKLEGIRVIDLSQFLPGPHLTMMMADHGAEVIKVENTAEGEPTRNIGYRKGGQSVYFRNTQRGKKSLTLNLKSDQGREVLCKLAETADVLLESFRPGVVDKLGVGYEALRKRAPGLIYCSISAFGQQSRHRERPAHDLSVQALAGTLSLSASESGAPVLPNLPGADALGSLMALSGILMALLRRQQSGQGDFLDISMFDALISWTCNTTGPVFAEGRAPVLREERTLGGTAFYQIYRSKDGGHVTLGGSEPKFVKNLLSALGREDLIETATQPPGPGQKPVVDFLKETFASKTRDEWAAWFEGKDVCFGPVRDLREVYDDPFLTEREMLLHDQEGLEHIGIPIKFREEPGQVNFHAPGHGEHARELLRGLGYGDAEIEAMKGQGVW